MTPATDTFLSNSFCVVLILLACLWEIQPVTAAAFTPEVSTVITCNVKPLSDMLHQTAVISDTKRQPEPAYRRTITRFIQQHYTKLGHELVTLHGGYLDSFHVLLGTTDRPLCDQFFREALLNTGDSNGFTQAILQWRFHELDNTESVQLFPAGS